MPTLQVSLLNNQDASPHNNEEEAQNKTTTTHSVTSTTSNAPTYTSVRSMKDLLNPSNDISNDINNDITILKYSQPSHDNKTSDKHSAKENFGTTTPGMTLPSLTNNHKPPSSNSEISLRLPSIEQKVLEPSTGPSSVTTDIHNAGSVTQLISVSNPQYYQFMNPTSFPLNTPLPVPSYPLPSLGVPPPQHTPPTPPPASPNSSLPAVKELLPSSQPLMHPSYQVPYQWYPFQPTNYTPPRQSVPYYGQVQEAIPVMLEAASALEEESRKRKERNSTAKTKSPPMAMGNQQSSNCQHHPKPDSDPKTIPFQLKFKSKKERPKNGAFEMQWMEHFTSLKQFYEQFGHTNVTRSTPGHKNLGNWVAEQRRKMRRGKLTKEQYDLMNSIAFEWDRSYFFKPSVFTNSDEDEKEGSEEKKFKSDAEAPTTY